MNTINQYSLWARNYPYPGEFVKFIKKPLAMRDYYDSMEETPRRVMIIEEGNPNLGFLDYSLTQNPFELMIKHFNAKHKHNLSNAKKNKFARQKKKIKLQKHLRKKNR
ncbi:hypothetical protein [Paenibacillus sp. FSL W8-0194]|uniref:hypothetical protein n=1 Tax=Paenibacillus sp. FSL W8-0194 TaxID=2921711 RepID=UPI0030DA95F8